MLRRICLVFSAFFLIFATLPATAQERRAERPFSAIAAEWARDLDRAERTVRDPDVTRQKLDELRGKLDAIRGAAEAAKAQARAGAAEQQPLLDALGQPPAKDAPRETGPVAEQRQQLTAKLTAFQDQAKQSDLTLTRTQALMEEIAAAERRRLARALFHRNSAPVDVELWGKASAQLAGLAAQLANAPFEWWNDLPLQRLGSAAATQGTVLLVALFALVIPFRARILRRLGRDPTLADPPHARRLIAAVAEGMGRILLPGVAAAALYVLLAANGLLEGLFGAVLRGAIEAFVVFAVIAGLARAALAPNDPGWRVIPLSADASRILGYRLVLLAGVVAIAVMWRRIDTVPGAVPAELDMLMTALITLTLAVLTMSLTQAGLWRLEAEPDAPVTPLRTLPLARLASRAAMLVVFVALAFGYYNLARYLTGGVLCTGLLVGLYLLLRLSVRDGLSLFLASDHQRVVAVRRALAIADASGQSFRFWCGGVIELVLLAAVSLLLLLVWGVPWQVLTNRLDLAMQGVTVGSVTISLADIAAAALIFAGCVIATRVTQRALENGVLPQTRLDPGIRHSVVAGFGYVGYVVAAVIGISALGLNLSNLALIAGALSVGIGFGLQNIVSNFVSGLILLVERPVKVGDWVMIGDREGYVRQISVRATEIETFRRASVIIPNSELLSSSLTNWTRRNRLGRIDVTVGAPYGCDIDRVRDILLDCIDREPRINIWPKPHVVLRDFTDRALVFVIRGAIDDVENRMFIESDLRFAIYKAYTENGIELPALGRDEYLHRPPPVEELLPPAGAERLVLPVNPLGNQPRTAQTG